MKTVFFLLERYAEHQATSVFERITPPFFCFDEFTRIREYQISGIAGLNSNFYSVFCACNNRLNANNVLYGERSFFAQEAT